MKIIIATVMLFLLSLPAFAQQPPQQAPQQPPQQRNFNITISEAQLNYIGKMLGKQPFEEAAPIIQTLQQQVNEQVKEKADKP